MNAIIELNDEETLAVTGGASVALAPLPLGPDAVSIQADALKRHGKRISANDPTAQNLLAATLAG